METPGSIYARLRGPGPCRTPRNSIGRSLLRTFVRTGLVVIGIVIAALGGGLVLTLFAISGGATTTTTQYHPEDPGLASGASDSWVVPGAATGSESISVSWSTTALANVGLWAATTCSAPGGFCPTGAAALNWSMMTSGKGGISAGSGATFLLVATNPGTGPMKFTGLVSVTDTPNSPVPTWSWGLIAAGGIALLAIGGIAVFLGLYLPGGVYEHPDAGPRAVRHPSLPPEEPDFEAEDNPP